MGQTYRNTERKKTNEINTSFAEMETNLKRFFRILLDKQDRKVIENTELVPFERLFRQLDTDFDGLLSAAEFKGGLRKLHYSEEPLWTLTAIRRWIRLRLNTNSNSNTNTNTNTKTNIATKHIATYIATHISIKDFMAYIQSDGLLSLSMQSLASDLISAPPSSLAQRQSLSHSQATHPGYEYDNEGEGESDDQSEADLFEGHVKLTGDVP
jgi:hypothetical protein